MQENGIAVRRYYTANHALKYYEGRYRNQDLGYTEAIRDRIVSLPLHTIMTEEELNKLFTTVERYIE
jgi:dTDP-4-amino-4,6-dideoxygalactose transaminase